MGAMFRAAGASMFGSCVFKLKFGLSMENWTKQQVEESFMD